MKMCIVLLCLSSVICITEDHRHVGIDTDLQHCDARHVVIDTDLKHGDARHVVIHTILKHGEDIHHSDPECVNVALIVTKYIDPNNEEVNKKLSLHLNILLESILTFSTGLMPGLEITLYR